MDPRPYSLYINFWIINLFHLRLQWIPHKWKALLGLVSVIWIKNVGQKETGQKETRQKETRQKETGQKVLHLGQKVLFKKF